MQEVLCEEFMSQKFREKQSNIEKQHQLRIVFFKPYNYLNLQQF